MGIAGPILSKCCHVRLVGMLFLILPLVSTAQLKVANYFSNNMVLQRGQPIEFWGYGKPGSRVIVEWVGFKKVSKTKRNGEWSVLFDPMEAGGPYTLRIEGGDQKKVFTNILVGDVWICSGQSNMEFSLRRSKDAMKEINESELNDLRFTTVPTTFSRDPQDTLKKALSWQVSGRQSSPFFSAVGYTFGKELNKDLDVPIGLIQSAWGGSSVKVWMPDEAMSIDPKLVEKRTELRTIDIEKYYNEFKQKRRRAIVAVDQGTSEEWWRTSTDLSEWKEIFLPTDWRSSGDEILASNIGVVWFKREVEPVRSGKTNFLVISDPQERIDVYFNETKLDPINANEASNLIYMIDAGLINSDGNWLTFRMNFLKENSGFKSMSEFYITDGSVSSPVHGIWNYKIGGILENPLPKSWLKKECLAALYNYMIHPLTRYPIKGVIWYQGESDSDSPDTYDDYFKAMIRSWRIQWDLGEFPFLFVQLAAFENKDDWAAMRDAQAGALTLPNTGMAMALDVGNPNDIHPKDKKTVGYRLSRVALEKAYQKDIVGSGPIFKNVSFDGNIAMVSFSKIGDGLITDDEYGYLKEFELAGNDRKFYPAQARIVSPEMVQLKSPEVTKALYVRYAWKNAPDSNLFNSEGLPTVPFKTD